MVAAAIPSPVPMERSGSAGSAEPLAADVDHDENPMIAAAAKAEPLISHGSMHKGSMQNGSMEVSYGGSSMRGNSRNPDGSFGREDAAGWASAMARIHKAWPAFDGGSEAQISKVRTRTRTSGKTAGAEDVYYQLQDGTWVRSIVQLQQLLQQPAAAAPRAVAPAANAAALVTPSPSSGAIAAACSRVPANGSTSQVDFGPLAAAYGTLMPGAASPAAGISSSSRKRSKIPSVTRDDPELWQEMVSYIQRGWPGVTADDLAPVAAGKCLIRQSGAHQGRREWNYQLFGSDEWIRSVPKLKAKLLQLDGAAAGEDSTSLAAAAVGQFAAVDGVEQASQQPSKRQRVEQLDTQQQQGSGSDQVGLLEPGAAASFRARVRSRWRSVAGELSWRLPTQHQGARAALIPVDGALQQQLLQQQLLQQQGHGQLEQHAVQHAPVPAGGQPQQHGEEPALASMQHLQTQGQEQVQHLQPQPQQEPVVVPAGNHSNFPDHHHQQQEHYHQEVGFEHGVEPADGPTHQEQPESRLLLEHRARELEPPALAHPTTVMMLQASLDSPLAAGLLVRPAIAASQQTDSSLPPLPADSDLSDAAMAPGSAATQEADSSPALQAVPGVLEAGAVVAEQAVVRDEASSLDSPGASNDDMDVSNGCMDHMQRVQLQLVAQAGLGPEMAMAESYQLPHQQLLPHADAAGGTWLELEPQYEGGVCLLGADHLMQHGEIDGTWMPRPSNDPLQPPLPLPPPPPLLLLPQPPPPPRLPQPQQQPLPPPRLLQQPPPPPVPRWPTHEVPALSLSPPSLPPSPQASSPPPLPGQQQSPWVPLQPPLSPLQQRHEQQQQQDVAPLPEPHQQAQHQRADEDVLLHRLKEALHQRQEQHEQQHKDVAPRSEPSVAAEELSGNQDDALICMLKQSLRQQPQQQQYDHHIVAEQQKEDDQQHMPFREARLHGCCPASQEHQQQRQDGQCRQQPPASERRQQPPASERRQQPPASERPQQSPPNEVVDANLHRLDWPQQVSTPYIRPDVLSYEERQRLRMLEQPGRATDSGASKHASSAGRDKTKDRDYKLHVSREAKSTAASRKDRAKSSGRHASGASEEKHRHESKEEDTVALHKHNRRSRGSSKDKGASRTSSRERGRTNASRMGGASSKGVGHEDEERTKASSRDMARDDSNIRRKSNRRRNMPADPVVAGDVVAAATVGAALAVDVPKQKHVIVERRSESAAPATTTGDDSAPAVIEQEFVYLRTEHQRLLQAEQSSKQHASDLEQQVEALQHKLQQIEQQRQQQERQLQKQQQQLQQQCDENAALRERLGQLQHLQGLLRLLAQPKLEQHRPQGFAIMQQQLAEQ